MSLRFVPLFSQARLLLVITVHDTFILLLSAMHSEPSRTSMTQDVALLHVISCTQYGTVSYRLCVVNINNNLVVPLTDKGDQ